MDRKRTVLSLSGGILGLTYSVYWLGKFEAQGTAVALGFSLAL